MFAVAVVAAAVVAAAVVAAMEIDDDRHDLAQRQDRLAGTLALAALPQPLHVERLKPCRVAGRDCSRQAPSELLVQ